MRHAPKGPVKAKTNDLMDGNDPMKAVRAVRCKATNRQGKQCGKAPIPGGTVCRMHGGAAPQVQMAAQERLKAMQPKALSTIDSLMGADEYPTVQLQAAKAVIDWTHGRAKELEEIKALAAIGSMSDEELKAKALALLGVG